MKLGSVKLSKAELNLTMSVRHMTKRKPTMLEWLVMHTLTLVEERPAYQSWPLRDLMGSLFGFQQDSADALIRPTILGLRDRDLVRTDTLSDQRTLADIAIGDIHLTDHGRAFRREGVIRSALSENSLTLHFDPESGSLSEGMAATRGTSPDGIPLQDAETIMEETAFPGMLVMQYLDGLKTTRNPYQEWLGVQTVIESVNPIERSISWIPVTQDVCWDKYGCHVRGASGEVAGKALESLDLDDSMVTDESQWPLLQGFDPDADMQCFYHMNDWQKLICEAYAASRVLVIRQKDYNAVVATIDSKGLKFLILTGAESNQMILTAEGAMLIMVRQDILPSDVLLLSNEQIIRRGRVILKAGNVERNMAFMYIPINTGHLLENLCEQIAANEELDHATVLLLRTVGQKTLGDRILAARLKSEPPLQKQKIRARIESLATALFSVSKAGKSSRKASKKRRR